MSETRLTRSNNDKIIAGVAGGIASYLAIDPILVRLAFLILLFASGIGFPIYLDIVDCDAASGWQPGS